MLSWCADNFEQKLSLRSGRFCVMSFSRIQTKPIFSEVFGTIHPDISCPNPVSTAYAANSCDRNLGKEAFSLSGRVCESSGRETTTRAGQTGSSRQPTARCDRCRGRGRPTQTHGLKRPFTNTKMLIGGRRHLESVSSHSASASCRLLGARPSGRLGVSKPRDLEYPAKAGERATSKRRERRAPLPTTCGYTRSASS